MTPSSPLAQLTPRALEAALHAGPHRAADVDQLYAAREASLLALWARGHVDVADLAALDRLGRVRVADDLWPLCSEAARQALRDDMHAHVRSAAVLAQDAVAARWPDPARAAAVSGRYEIAHGLSGLVEGRAPVSSEAQAREIAQALADQHGVPFQVWGPAGLIDTLDVSAHAPATARLQPGESLQVGAAHVRYVQAAAAPGQYVPTAIDAHKASADFRLTAVGAMNTIVWADGRVERVSDRQLAQLQAGHRWATDF